MKTKTSNVRTRISKKAIHLAALFLLMIANRSIGSGWQGTDDFSSAAYSSNNWTFYQQEFGQMTVQVTNGHASFVDQTTTANAAQTAFIAWNGTPTVADGWMVDITGHNTVPSGNGGPALNHGSALFLGVMDTEAWRRGELYVFAVGLGQAGGGSSFGSEWLTPNGSTNPVVVPCTNNTLFSLRLVYYPASQTIQAWYDPTGSGLSWTNLDSMTVSQMSASMTATNTFSFVIVGNTYYGPISEGQMWADNFRAMPTPPPLLLSGEQHSAEANVLHLTWTNNGSMFLLQSAGALTGGWSTAFTSWTTNAGWVSTSVTNSSPAQFYRLKAN